MIRGIFIKKIIILIFIVIFCINAGFASDTRKKILFCPDFSGISSDEQEVLKLIEAQVTDYIYKLRKYRIVIRDQTIYDEVKLMLSGIAQGGSEYQAQLDTDGIIYVQILDTFSERGKNDSKEWIDFHAIVNYKFVYVKTGEVLNSRKIDAYSRAYIEKDISVQQAFRTSKLLAVDFISQEISKDMSHAFILSAKVSGEKWLDLFYIDGGTNCGISENMTFNFVENLNNSAGTYEVIEGKAVVVEAFPDSSIIKVLEKPL